MVWKIKSPEKEWSVKLPSYLSKSSDAKCQVNGEEVCFKWDDAEKIITIIENGCEQNYHIRNFSAVKFPGECETQLEIELVGRSDESVGYFTGTAEIHVPGQENRIAAASGGKTTVRSPIAGNILSIAVENGHEVQKGDTLMIIEAMKMENKILASRNGKISDLSTNTGDQVPPGQKLLTIS
tara:strand:+ start:984 stop:1529 length:546 start_codon:yes stop_codon:yes gene_type:complete